LVGLRKARRTISNRAQSVVWVGLASLACLVVAACSTTEPAAPAESNRPPPGFFPNPAVTEGGVATNNLYVLTFVIAVIVFVLVEGLLLFITLRFRRRAGDDELPRQVHGSNPLEILWTIVPAITVTGLFLGAIITLNEAEAAEAETPAVVIDVTGFQWQWTFAYENEDVSMTGVGREGPVMGVPVNEPIHIRLHATDVIHSFYVPQFLYKKDVIPGRVNEFEFVARKPGTYRGQCAEFCGLSHYQMYFHVEAMERAQYDAWLEEQKTAGPSGAPSAPAGAPVIEVHSVSVTAGFDPAELNAPADSPWAVHLTNSDPAAPHDFSIRGANPDGSDWLGDPDAQGGQEATYLPPPLKAADYEFYCSIHPNMTGTLHVGR